MSTTPEAFFVIKCQRTARYAGCGSPDGEVKQEPQHVDAEPVPSAPPTPTPYPPTPVPKAYNGAANNLNPAFEGKPCSINQTPKPKFYGGPEYINASLRRLAIMKDRPVSLKECQDIFNRQPALLPRRQWRALGVRL